MVERDTALPFAASIFAKSPLKQEKLAAITSYLPPLDGLTCLDIGADNGVLSLLLRARGGSWYSADLNEATVESIRALVHDRVDLITEKGTPYADGQFDLVAIIDLLEHLHDDKAFVRELHRITKTGATVIVNVPNPTKGIIRQLKLSAGQTDEAHGHIRPGYSADELRTLLAPHFEVVEVQSYRRAIMDMLDFTFTLASDLTKSNARGNKGSVVTEAQVQKKKGLFSLFGIAAPALQLLPTLDRLLWFHPGNMVIAKVVRKDI